MPLRKPDLLVANLGLVGGSDLVQAEHARVPTRLARVGVSSTGRRIVASGQTVGPRVLPNFALDLQPDRVFGRGLRLAPVLGPPACPRCRAGAMPVYQEPGDALDVDVHLRAAGLR